MNLEGFESALRLVGEHIFSEHARLDEKICTFLDLDKPKALRQRLA
jgi:hypothetical protein